MGHKETSKPKMMVKSSEREDTPITIISDSDDDQPSAKRRKPKPGREAEEDDEVKLKLDSKGRRVPGHNRCRATPVVDLTKCPCKAIPVFLCAAKRDSVLLCPFSGQAEHLFADPGFGCLAADTSLLKVETELPANGVLAKQEELNDNGRCLGIVKQSRNLDSSLTSADVQVRPLSEDSARLNSMPKKVRFGDIH